MASDEAKALRDTAPRAQSHDPQRAYHSLAATIREMLEQVLDERNLSGRVEPV
jgi:predicted component of type VI protein secretion system